MADKPKTGRHPDQPRKLDRVQITDHAIVRWMERHHGISREDVLREMFGSEPPRRVPDGQYSAHNSECYLVFRENVMVSVVARSTTKPKTYKRDSKYVQRRRIEDENLNQMER